MELILALYDLVVLIIKGFIEPISIRIVNLDNVEFEVMQRRNESKVY